MFNSVYVVGMISLPFRYVLVLSVTVARLLLLIKMISSL